jgi:hypothetical protein
MANNTPLPFPHPRDCPTRAEILLHKEAIKSLDEDISEVRKEVAELLARLQQLQQKKANYSSYISPLRSLPTDILREIVYTCFWSGIDLMTLAQICGTLRNVVVGMPSLWKGFLLRGINPKPIYKIMHYRVLISSRMLLAAKGPIAASCLQNSTTAGNVPYQGRVSPIKSSD